MLTAVIQLGAEDVAEVAVAGDSDAVLVCGRRAGAATRVGVTGPRGDQRLRRAGATHLIRTIGDLPDVLMPAIAGPEATDGEGVAREPPAPESPGHAHPGIVPPQVTFREKHAGL